MSHHAQNTLAKMSVYEEIPRSCKVTQGLLFFGQLVTWHDTRNMGVSKSESRNKLFFFEPICHLSQHAKKWKSPEVKAYTNPSFFQTACHMLRHVKNRACPPDMTLTRRTGLQIRNIPNITSRIWNTRLKRTSRKGG
jgi:hypothetical protein